MNKASGGDRIPVELFQILKDDAVKVLHSICQHIWKTLQWPQNWKRSVFIPVPKKENAKECSNHHTVALISHATKVMLKILQARLQQYVNREIPDVQAGFRQRNQRPNCQHLLDHGKSKRVPGELFQILKDDAVKVLHSICQQIWKTLQWPQDWKRSVFIPIPKKRNAKECSNNCTTPPISHASKVMLKILQARLQQYANRELPDVQAGVRKGRGTRDQIADIHWIIEKAREFQKKTSISALLTMPKPLTMWITTNCGKF